jgi:hypothetical protein
MRLVPLLCLPLLFAGACQTARGHVEAGRLEQGCLAVERAPSPLIDDDGRALAARIRRRLEGSIHVRAVPVDELRTIARAAPAAVPTDGTTGAAPAVDVDVDVVVRDAPAVVDVAVVGDGVMRLRAVTLIAADGTRLEAPALTEDVILDLVGAPPPPPKTVHTSTHTPGPFEALMKGIGIAMIGLPLSIATLGAIPPDLGGALSPTATTTSTWTTDHPDLQAWKDRPEVQAAARLGAFFELGRATCAGGRCRQVLTVARADAWRQAELEISLGVGDCGIDDVVTVDLGAAVPFKDTAADDGQWGRFWDEGLGLRPVVEDIGEGLDGCVECGATCFGC